MKGCLNKILLTLFLVGFFPLISSAQWLPSGPECSPKDDFNPTHTQTCPYKDTGSDKPREVHLKWSITPKGSGTQVCGLGCTREDGKSCNGSMFKDSKGFSTSTVATRLTAKDDIKINDKSLSTGNTYQTFCCAPKNSSQQSGDFLNRLIDICQDNTLTLSQKMKISDSVDCEVGLTSILDGLAKGTKVTITEENFDNWTSPDLKDNVTLSKGLGSGDKMDILKVMDGMQSCQRLPNPADPDYYQVKITGYDNVVSQIKSSVDNNDPIMIGIINQKGDWGHAMLALSLDLVSNDDVSVLIDAFDPNFPGGTTSLSCKKEKGTVIPGQGYYYFLSCHHPGYSKDYRVFIPVTLNSQRLDCGVSNRVRPMPTKWLFGPANSPNFENPTTTNNTKGICYGYTEFVRNVACFGDFSNEDFHPNDGKVVGRDCDTSHNPIVARGPNPTLPNRFVASVSSVATLLLSRLGSIFDI